MTWSGTRRRLLALGGAGIAVSAARVMGARAGTPLLSGVSVDNGGRPFAGDSELVATLGVVSAPVVARLRFRLARRSLVTLDVLETGQGVASEKPAAAVAQTALAERRVTLEPGEHELTWTPDPSLPGP